MFKNKILIVIFFLSVISISQAADPVAYYRFKDGGTHGDNMNNIIDYTLNGHNGIAYNASYGVGVIDESLIFIHPFSYVDIPDDPVFSFTNGMQDYDYSISFWCTASNYSNVVLVSKGHFTPNHEYSCYSGGNGQIYFYMKDSGTFLHGNFKYGRTQDSLRDYTDEWLNIVVTHGPLNKINIFVNGESWITYDYIGENYTSMKDGTDNVSIGQVNGFINTIEMDEVKIWDSYLTDLEVEDLYE